MHATVATFKYMKSKFQGMLWDSCVCVLFEERSGFKTANPMTFFFFFISGPGVNYSGCQITWAKFCKVSHRVNSIHEAAS